MEHDTDLIPESDMETQENLIFSDDICMFDVESSPSQNVSNSPSLFSDDSGMGFNWETAEDLSEVMFRNDEQELQQILDNKLYAKYEYIRDGLRLSELEKYYYEDYISILRIVSSLSFVSEEQLGKLHLYLGEFQTAVDRCFTHLGIAIPDTPGMSNAEGELFMFLPNVSIDPEISSRLSLLELSLHYLTKEHILSAIEELGVLALIDSDGKSEACINTTDRSSECKPPILQAMQVWDALIQQVYNLHSDEIERTEHLQNRDQYLMGLHQDVAMSCYKDIIAFAQQAAINFQKICEQASNKAATIYENIACYQTIYKCVRFLKLIESPADFHAERHNIISCFGKYNTAYKSAYLKFFDEQIAEKFQAFNQRYDEVKRCTSPGFTKQYEIVAVYSDLISMITLQGYFIEQYDFPSKEEYNKIYAKFRENQKQGASHELLEFLFFLLKLVDQNSRLYYGLCCRTLEQKITILRTIEPVIYHRRALYQDHHSDVSLTYDGEYKRFNAVKKGLQENSLGIQSDQQRINCIEARHQFFSMTHKIKFQKKPLRKALGIVSVNTAVSNALNSHGFLKEFTALCFDYGGDSWVSSSNTNGPEKTSKYIPRLR